LELANEWAAVAPTGKRPYVFGVTSRVRQASSEGDQRALNFPSTATFTGVQTDRRVLVVDDDDGVRTAVTWALEADGFEVLAVDNGLAALDAIEAVETAGSTTLSLVVLDLSLPGLGGLDILNRVRTTEARDGRRRLPIIVLSGRDSEMDRIVGLDLGADDYLVKPFSPSELAARARSVLRRSAEPAVNGRQPFQPTGSGVEIDRESRNVWVDGAPVELAAKEFDLLAYLVGHPQRACRRSELLAAVWSSESGWQNEATVTEHVYRLRLKIETDPQHPKWLCTVRAVGYRWEG
jgi:two-component system, OmpR family, phosphate regulon response regulator PhoB